MELMGFGVGLVLSVGVIFWIIILTAKADRVRK